MKSLELNWIRKKVDKSIPIPEVMFFPLDTASGMYFEPDYDNEMYDEDGRPHFMSHGVIVVSTLFEDVESTLAHEWRHHWQQFNGIKYDRSITTHKYDEENIDYDKFIFQYFNTSQAELDALRFQYKYSTIHDEWEELLFDELKDLHVKPVITYANNTIINKQKIYTRSSTIRYSRSSNKKTR